MPILRFAVAWLLLLDGRIRLQLGFQVTITRSQDGVAEAQILAHHFRTCRSGEAEQRRKPFGMKDGSRR